MDKVVLLQEIRIYFIIIYNENNHKLQNLLKAALKTKAKINFGIQDINKRTAYHAIAIIPAPYSLSHLKLMLQLDSNVGHNINLADKNGITPLHLACMLGRSDIVEVLIDAGADINQKDKKGNLPQHYLAKGKKAMLSAFEKVGINVNRDEMAVHNALCDFDEMVDCANEIEYSSQFISRYGFITTPIIHDDALLNNPGRYVNLRHVLAAKQNAEVISIVSSDSPMMDINGYNAKRAYLDSFTGISVISASINNLDKVANILCQHGIDPYAINHKGETVIDLLQKVNLPEGCRASLIEKFQSCSSLRRSGPS